MSTVNFTKLPKLAGKDVEAYCVTRCGYLILYLQVVVKIKAYRYMIKGSGYPACTCTANFEYTHAIHNDILLNDFTWDIGDTVSIETGKAS